MQTQQKPKPQSHVSITPPTPVTSPPDITSQVSITPSNASTFRPPNHYNSQRKTRNRTAAWWKRLVQRRQAICDSKQRELDILQRIIEQNQQIDQTTDLMTEPSAPDTISITSIDDSLFHVPRYDAHHASDVSTSSNSTVSNDSASSLDTCSTNDSAWYDNLAPPPPGSLLDLWDKPFNLAAFHDFPDLSTTAWSQLTHLPLRS